MLDNLNIEIRYLRKARRGTIRILPNSTVKVTVPFGVPEIEIKKLLLAKADWILKKQRALEQVQNQRKINFVTGQLLPFLGEELQLKIIEGYAPVVKSHDQLIVSVPKAEDEIEKYVKSVLVKWYKARALEKIQQHVAHYSSLLAVKPKSIAIKNYKSRWGACSSKGALIFNWQIVMFSQNHFNYVIAHELCHLKEMNHSKKFYQMLEDLGFQKKEIHSQMRYLRNLF
jgi:predicted metal-dependent hydrolase